MSRRRLLTMAEAAAEMGYSGAPANAHEWAIRRIRSAERRTGRALLVPMGGEGPGARYGVARADVVAIVAPAEALRDEVVEATRVLVDEMREGIEEQLDALRGLIGECLERDHVLAEQMRTLSEPASARTSPHATR